jgi:hypothetical protein
MPTREGQPVVSAQNDESVPYLGQIPQVHTDPDGHEWTLTVHWALADGRATPVGLDIRAFTPSGRRRATPAGGTLNAAVLRSIRVGELIEATRRRGNWQDRLRAAGGTKNPAHEEPRRRGPGRPADLGDDFIARVAAFYREAKAQGGEPARKPWRYVTRQLNAQGMQRITDGQLRNWSRRAKRLGLLPTKEKE